MSTTIPETQPLSPTMRHTLELVKWVAEGFASAHRIRRARIAGAPEFTGAEAMEMYLKSQGIDLPHLDQVVRGLMEDGNAAAAVKEVADVVSEAAVRSPKDLSELVQRLAHAATGRVPQPDTTTAPPGRPLIRPEFIRGTSPSGGKPRFRPEYTSAARRSGGAAHVPCVDPPPPAANEAPHADPSVCVDATRPASTVASPTSCACTDPPAPAGTVAGTADRPAQTEADVEGTRAVAKDEDPRPQRLDALERRLDALEADLAREIAALRQWTTEQLRVLSERIAASTAASESLKQEHEALKQRVQQLEAALASREDQHAAGASASTLAARAEDRANELPEETSTTTPAEDATSTSRDEGSEVKLPEETRNIAAAEIAAGAPTDCAEAAPAQVPPLATPGGTLPTIAAPEQGERRREEGPAVGSPTAEEEPRPAGQEHGSPSPAQPAACPMVEQMDRMERRMDRFENDQRSALSVAQESIQQITELHRKLPTHQGDSLS